MFEINKKNLKFAAHCSEDILKSPERKKFQKKIPLSKLKRILEEIQKKNSQNFSFLNSKIEIAEAKKTLKF